MKSIHKASPRSFITWGCCMVLLFGVAGCSNQPRNLVVPGETPSQSSPPSANSTRDVANEAVSFATQIATYSSATFDKLPGWLEDNQVESWPALLSSCTKLSSRSPQWAGLCQRAQSVDRTNNLAVRKFYEQEFSLYQLRDDAKKIDGVITAYFEPDIQGSRQYKAPYIYPVYGVPDDMVFLDARKIDRKIALAVVVARVEGRNVSVQVGLNTREINSPGIYSLDLTKLTLDTLDRKVRLRVDGKRLVPYFTRSEIEKQGAPNAKVLAFVDNLWELYEMQIQGTGRIKLTDGSTLHLSYAEQNGHPFIPPGPPAGSKVAAAKTRGGFALLDTNEDSDDEDPTAVRTRGFKLTKPPSGTTVAVSGRKTTQPATGSGISDPSYVFFKENPPTGTGPLGALNVPLLPGRSIAVDPRSTPLGYPVFLSTRDPSTGKPMQRLTVAQDTGGAIRGAVRADYFVGNGALAAKQARRMKENGQLWLLLPKGLQVATGGSLTKTRGAGSRDLPQCLLPTEDICVEDE